MKTYKWKVWFAEHDLPGFLDMLRYDAATVVTWSRAGETRRGDLFEVTLAGHRFTPERWSSFGLRSELVGYGA